MYKVGNVLFQVSTTQAEADKENDILKASSADKEERAEGLLKNDRNCIMQLTDEEKNKLSKELAEGRSRLDYYDRNKGNKNQFLMVSGNL